MTNSLFRLDTEMAWSTLRYSKKPWCSICIFDITKNFPKWLILYCAWLNNRVKMARALQWLFYALVLCVAFKLYSLKCSLGRRRCWVWWHNSVIIADMLCIVCAGSCWNVVEILARHFHAFLRCDQFFRQCESCDWSCAMGFLGCLHGFTVDCCCFAACLYSWQQTYCQAILRIYI